MNHNIVIDEEGNEHQAVEPTGFACSNCSLKIFNCDNFLALARNRQEKIKQKQSTSAESKSGI